MKYNEILAEVKQSFIEKLKKIVTEETYEANSLSKEDGFMRGVYLETIYTDIMALGYNFGDLKKAIDDIYEIQGGDNDIEFYKELRMRVEETARQYSDLIPIFSNFHKETQAGEDFEKVLKDIRLALEI